MRKLSYWTCKLTDCPYPRETFKRGRSLEGPVARNQVDEEKRQEEKSQSADATQVTVNWIEKVTHHTQIAQ